MTTWMGFLPITILAAGGLVLAKVHGQEEMPLLRPLAEVRDSLLGLPGQDVTISPDEQRVAGMDSYLMRYYVRPDSTLAFSLYVGYYEAQSQGRTIHSPKNCLPGAGWEPVSAGTATIVAEGDSLTVNRYLLENQGRRVVVYYWYQGRGRVAWNEYAVKWELLRDKATLGRSEEALVRLVIPALGSEATADSIAAAAAAVVIPEVARFLPPRVAGTP